MNIYAHNRDPSCRQNNVIQKTAPKPPQTCTQMRTCMCVQTHTTCAHVSTHTMSTLTHINMHTCECCLPNPSPQTYRESHSQTACVLQVQQELYWKLIYIRILSFKHNISQCTWTQRGTRPVQNVHRSLRMFEWKC